MDKLNLDFNDDNDSLTEEEWDQLVALMQNPATTELIAKKLRRFVIQQLLGNDGARKFRSLGRRLSLEDVAQSALGSILRVAEGYKDKRGDELRAIFRAIVSNKRSDKHTFHRRERRDIRQEVFAEEAEKETGSRPRPSDEPQRLRTKKNGTAVVNAEAVKRKQPKSPVEEDGYSFDEWIMIAAQGALPEDGLLFKETVQQVSSDYRDVLMLTLARFSLDEIAEELGCSRRTVTRRQRILRNELKRILGFDPTNEM